MRRKSSSGVRGFQKLYILLLFLCILLFLLLYNLQKAASLLYGSATDDYKSGRYDNYCDRKRIALSEPCLCYADFLDTYPDPVNYTSVACALTIQPLGRMGNVIGQYVALYALAKLNGRPAFQTPEMADILGHYFRLSLPVISLELYDGLKWKGKHVTYTMDDAYKNLEGLFIKLDGYPYSKRYFLDYIADIRKEFSLRDEFRKRAQLTLRMIAASRGSTSVTFVGVHVRRGDYVEYSHHKYHMVLADRKYFEEATSYFRSRYADAVFIVVSNDMRWCVNNIANERGDVFYVGNNNEGEPITDFALLVNCNHTIYTYGTYGYYAAVLAGGEAVYFTNYTTDSRNISFFHFDSPLDTWHPIAADLSPLLNAAAAHAQTTPAFLKTYKKIPNAVKVVKESTPYKVETNDVGTSTVASPEPKSDVVLASTESPKSKRDVMLTSTKSPESKSDVILASTKSPESKSDVVLTSTKSPQSKSDVVLASTESPKSKRDVMLTSTKSPQSKSDVVLASTESPESKSDVILASTKSPESKSDVILASTKSPESKSDVILASTKSPESKSDVVLSLTSTKSLESNSEVILTSSESLKSKSDVIKALSKSSMSANDVIKSSSKTKINN